ncbi:MAG: ammonia channel protein, partial [Novosphingobium sp.]
SAPSLGGPGAADYDMGAKLVVQVLAVATTIGWAAVATVIAMYVSKAVTGLRVTEEVEREGLDLGEHGERAYNY